MPDVVVIGGTEGNASEAEPSAIASDATEALAEASTEVAQIAADRDIKIAEIQAEVSSEAIEAASEAQTSDAELQQCRQSIETLGNQVATLAETMLSIQKRLEASPPNQPLSDAVVDPERTEAPPKPEQTRKKKALRWI